MSKTNRFIYAYKVKWKNGIDLNDLKTKYHSNNMWTNFINFPDRKCRVSLVYIGDSKNEVVFFKLVKADQKNISVIDFNENTETSSYLGKGKNVKRHALLAFINKNVLLTLYDHDSFGYSTSILVEYIKSSLNKELIPEIIPAHIDDDEKREMLNGVKNIIIKKARVNFDSFEYRSSSKKKLRKYRNIKEDIIKMNYTTNIPGNALFKWIERMRKKKNPDSIIVTCENQEKVDILGEFYLRFPCNIRTNRDGLSLENDFTNAIEEITLSNLNTFNRYKEN